MIVSTDVVGVPRAVADEVAARVEKQHGLKRSQLLINASHTHTGPVVWPNLQNLTVFPPAEQEKLLVYQRKFTDALVAAIGAAIRDLARATVEYGEGSVGFAINRRQATASGVKIGVDPNGPVDHTVPVLKITRCGWQAPRGALRSTHAITRPSPRRSISSAAITQDSRRRSSSASIPARPPFS